MKLFWSSDFAPESCAIHQVVGFGEFSKEGMKNSNGVSCFSTPDLSVVSENATGCNPFTRPCPIACRRVGGAIINSSTPRVLCRSNTSSTNRPRFCKNPGADSNPPQAIFQPTTGPLIVAAERIIWDCSAEAWHEITR